MKKHILNYEPAMVLVLVVQALLVRMAYLWEISGSAIFNLPVGDSERYFTRAQQIADGLWQYQGTYDLAPLYTFVLSQFFKVFNAGPLMPALAQCLAATLTCLLVWFLAREYFGVRTALLTLLIVAFSPVQVFYTGVLDSVSYLGLVNLSFVVLFHLALKNQGLRKSLLLLAAGITVGVSTHFKQEMILALPFLFIWLVLQEGFEKGPLLKKSALVLAGFVAVIAPFTAHNYKQSKEFVLLVPENGINFYIGNNLSSQGVYRETVWRPGSKVLPPLESFRTEASRREKQELTLVQSSNYWAMKTFKTIVEDPSHWIRLQFRKAALFVNAAEQSKEQSYYLGLEYSVLLRWLPFSFGLIGPLALFGIFMYRRKWRDIFPVYAFPAVVFVSTVLFYHSSEIRLLSLPFFSIFAAAGLLKLVSIIRWKQERAIGACIIFLVVASLLVNLPRYKPDPGVAWHRLSSAAEKQGFTKEAREFWKKAANRQTQKEVERKR